MGKRTLLGSVRRNLALFLQHRKQTMSGLIASPYDRELGIVSPSNVTNGVESITNLGSTASLRFSQPVPENSHSGG